MMSAGKHRQRGAALLLTLLLIAFNLVLLMALLLYSSTEQTASRNSVNAEAARIMALNGVELAGALIAQNSTNNAYVSYQNITNISGDRLETKIANTVTSGNQWTRVVTNPTTLHSGFAAPSADTVDLNYATPTDPASGYIAPRTNPSGSNWRNLHTNMFQMKWVDVYKGATNQPTNLVGRFAFWVDDESTKLNVNYAGTHLMYDATTFAKGYHAKIYPLAMRFPPFDRTKTTNKHSEEFTANDWPVFMELGGAAGITRSNAYNILFLRGMPNLWDDKNNFYPHKPFYSVLEARTGASNALTNISQQSQFAFTATMFSREPELSIATGAPRFDVFEFSREWSGKVKTLNEVSAKFIAAITNSYPEFWNKYNLPQFAAAIHATCQEIGSGDAVATNVARFDSPNSPAGQITNYNARPLPLINETVLKLVTYLERQTNNTVVPPTFQTNTIVSVETSCELINLASSSDATGAYTIFDELHMSGSAYETNRDRYRVRVNFEPGISVNGVTTNVLELKPVATKWFSRPPGATDTNGFRFTDQVLTGGFAVLTNVWKQTNNNTVLSKVSWSFGSSPDCTNTTTVFYRTKQNDLTGLGQYQQVNVVFKWPNGGVENPIVYTPDVPNTPGFEGTNPVTVFELVSCPREDSGIRSDPRLGLHGLSPLSPAFKISGTAIGAGAFVSSDATLGYLNKGWTANTGPNSSEFLSDTDNLSPDITSDYTVFQSDRGFTLLPGQLSGQPRQLKNSALIGEVPITTQKGGRHLAWSTPRFWGNGRTNMGDGNSYPPDWLMLDCVHTALLPYNDKKVFVTQTNDYMSFGRLNINGLKTYFQTPKSPTTNSDTVMDSMLMHARTKDFYEYYKTEYLFPKPPNKGSELRYIDPTNSRGVLLEFINTNAVARAARNEPYITPYAFAAELAGSTNSTLLSLTNTYWEAYTSGATNTSDHRIESLVRSLQQKLTSHGWQFSVYSIGQAVQVIDLGGGTYKTNVLGEAYMQGVWERAPKHDNSGVIVNQSPGGAPPMRMLYMREIR